MTSRQPLPLKKRTGWIILRRVHPYFLGTIFLPLPGLGRLWDRFWRRCISDGDLPGYGSWWGQSLWAACMILAVPSCQCVMEVVPLPIPCVDWWGRVPGNYLWSLWCSPWSVHCISRSHRQYFCQAASGGHGIGLVYWSGGDFWVSDEEWQVFPRTACLDLFPGLPGWRWGTISPWWSWINHYGYG